MRVRKGQFVRARRRKAQSLARQERIRKTAVLLDLGFEVDEISAILEVSRSTVYDYKNSVEHKEYQISSTINAIENLRSELDIADLDKKEAGRLYYNVKENYSFGATGKFCSALKYALELEDKEYEEVSFKDMNNYLDNFVSRANSYQKKKNRDVLIGVSSVSLGILSILGSLGLTISQGDFSIILMSILGILMAYLGIEKINSDINEEMEEYFDIQIDDYEKIDA